MTPNKVCSVRMYDTPMKGFSTVGNQITVIGEQTIERDGKLLEQYLYNVDGYTPENGLPFVSLKCNIII